MESAFRLIAKGGIAALSLTVVGESAGFSRELPRYHYGSKDAFIEALIDDSERVWSEHLARPGQLGLSGLDALYALFDSLEKIFSDEQVTIGRLTLGFELSGSKKPALRKKMNAQQAATRRHIIEILQGGVSSGVLAAGVDTESLAALLVAAYRGIGYQWLTNPKSLDMPATLKCLRELFIAKLTQEPEIT